MRIERMSDDQFTIFLTFDDLIERGFTKEDLWHDASSVRTLFSDMMYEASSELGFELEGMLLVQVQLMQAQGMHVIVTQKEEMEYDEDFIEMKVTLDESNELIFSFNDFENIIQVCSYLSPLGVNGGEIYYMSDSYYVLLNEEDLNGQHKEDIIAIMSEYAFPSIITSIRLKEYGKIIFSSQAVQQVVQYFLMSKDGK
ncbi:genetic competence negative regulator [Virgibacillus halodenitrificans]|uniref:genetic competence negative regulator n=1 Tax=Virgibacillus halodenitrificans TaxID=1482 RepID=UPI0024C0DEC1|nr:genetic competence negative regulator [Virgibacillus halodenitrificans]WHX27382.1 genetic competence negative regulator [Virgibacillus halodenitrificans]